MWECEGKFDELIKQVAEEKLARDEDKRGGVIQSSQISEENQQQQDRAEVNVPKSHDQKKKRRAPRARKDKSVEMYHMARLQEAFDKWCGTTERVEPTSNITNEEITNWIMTGNPNYTQKKSKVEKDIVKDVTASRKEKQEKRSKLTIHNSLMRIWGFKNFMDPPTNFDQMLEDFKKSAHTSLAKLMEFKPCTATKPETKPTEKTSEKKKATPKKKEVKITPSEPKKESNTKRVKRPRTTIEDITMANQYVMTEENSAQAEVSLNLERKGNASVTTAYNVPTETLLPPVKNINIISDIRIVPANHEDDSEIPRKKMKLSDTEGAVSKVCITKGEIYNWIITGYRCNPSLYLFTKSFKVRQNILKLYYHTCRDLIGFPDESQEYKDVLRIYNIVKRYDSRE